MATEYKYRSNKHTRLTTIIYFALFFVIAFTIAALSDGGYFTAWFISFIVAIMALMVISIPRKIVVDEEALNIVCVLEIVEIPIAEIVSINRVAPKRGEIIPIFGSIGFFGYYGYYLDTSTWEKVMLYATEWHDLVEIINSYDDRYYISCRDADQLIEQVESYFESEEEGEDEEVTD